MNDLTNDQLVSALIVAIRSYYTSDTSETRDSMKTRAEVLEAQLRARLAALEPLAQAAVTGPVDRLGDAVDHLIEVRQWLIDQGRKDLAASIWFAIEWTSGAKQEWEARAQAQDGAA